MQKKQWHLVTQLCLWLIAIGFISDLAIAGNQQAGNDSQNDSEDADERGLKPLVKWSFEKDELGAWSDSKGNFDAGPRPPVFPSFKADNRAALFNKAGSAIVLKEADAKGAKLKFGLGDGITIEAWVNVSELGNGDYRYLIGKGRNRNSKFEPENQNYALRLKGEGGEARPSFLFRSESKKFDSAKDYHRWTASEGFSAGTGWHHVAVSFTFGKADSIKGFVDGKEVKGTWDMGGKTDRAPVSDDDDLTIGTGNGGGAGNSFNGWLDEVAIYRDVLPTELLASRFQYVPPPPVVAISDLVPGKVLVQICEQGVPEKNAWPTISPQATETFNVDAFGLVDVPQKYVDSGVRGDRPIPYLLRAASLVKLPAGKHRLLLRSRGAAHLHIDGKKTLTIGFPKGDAGGHGYVSEQDGFLNLGPDFRFAPPGTQETWCEFESKGGEHLVLVEQLVGGVLGKAKRRPELGEFVVAWSRAGASSWELMSPNSEKQLAYNDLSWPLYEAEQRARLDVMNSAQRAKLQAAQVTYWDRRRQAARDWLASTKDEPVPEILAGWHVPERNEGRGDTTSNANSPRPSPEAQGVPLNHPIDRFLITKLANVTSQNADSQRGSVDYFRNIQPLLEAKCYDCHRGGKAKGALKLDVRADAIKGGDSGDAAIVPQHPEKSELLARVSTTDKDLIMPPKGDPLTKEQIELLTTWIKEGAVWPEFKTDNLRVLPVADDLTFLRRAFLDTVGVVPSLKEIEESKDMNRQQLIDRLLADPRWADHWMGYWQDVLAENPNMLNPTLNNSGPFRWWIYESLLDNKPMDLFVTELLRMRGSERFGGPAGFAVASQNDAPMAQKGTIVSAAFLGVEMKCARCHDAPAHVSSQRDLFELAAMLGKQPQTVPLTSSVSAEKLTAGGRKPLIQVTLAAGTKVEPKWPFGRFAPEDVAAKLAQDETDPRDKLAALMTAPQNERFAQVIANRVWKRFMGRGIVEPVDDWEKGSPSHPELLRWLGRELVRSGYDVKHLARVIMTSRAYQRTTDINLKETSPLFASPAPRRLGAEQIVDSLFVAMGKPFRVEEISLDIDGRRDLGNSISLGHARRSWMLTTSSNERDRPSLNLPRMQAVTDVLSAFGWRGARQDPTSVRELAPNALQPAILSNGTMTIWLTRLSDDHGLTQLALEDRPLDQFLDALFLRLLTRHPTDAERDRYLEHLTPGFDSRKVKTLDSERQATKSSAARRPAKYVSWSNHLDPEATLVRQEQELAARQGDPPTNRLTPTWRQRLEDVLWALLNAPEWVHSP